MQNENETLILINKIGNKFEAYKRKVEKGISNTNKCKLTWSRRSSFVSTPSGHKVVAPRCVIQFGRMVDLQVTNSNIIIE